MMFLSCVVFDILVYFLMGRFFWIMYGMSFIYGRMGREIIIEGIFIIGRRLLNVLKFKNVCIYEI